MNVRPIVARATAPLLLSGAAAVVCCVTLGPTLGLAFGGFAIASILSPQFALDVNALPARSISAIAPQVAIALPVFIGWTWATFAGGWDAVATLGLCTLLATYIAMLAAAAIAIGALVGGSLSTALVTFMALAWLAWPIWTAPWMTQRLADRLISIHPLFAANTVTGGSPWPQHEVIYGLTRLGQDLSYALPNSIWPAVCVQLGIAVLCALLRYGSRRLAVGLPAHSVEPRRGQAHG